MDENHLLARLLLGVDEWNKWVRSTADEFSGNFEKISFPEGMDFTGIYMPDVSFNYSKLQEAVFNNSELRATRFEYVDLKGAKFIDARIGGVWSRRLDPGYIADFTTFFHEADLTSADFTSVDAVSADFRKANLTDAVFRKANLRKANFEGAILLGADFTDAILDEAQFDEAAPQHLIRRSGTEPIPTKKPLRPVQRSTSKQLYPASPVAAPAASETNPESITELYHEIDRLRSIVANLVQSNIQRSTIESDIKLIEAEVERPDPRRLFLKMFLDSLRDNLAKALGASMATALIAAIAALMAKIFGVF